MASSFTHLPSSPELPMHISLVPAQARTVVMGYRVKSVEFVPGAGESTLNQGSVVFVLCARHMERKNKRVSECGTRSSGIASKVQHSFGTLQRPYSCTLRRLANIQWSFKNGTILQTRKPQIHTGAERSRECTIVPDKRCR